MQIQVCLVRARSIRRSSRLERLEIRWQTESSELKETRRTERGSISPTFYAQLLCAQIPKAQKDSQVKQDFCTYGICARKSCT